MMKYIILQDALIKAFKTNKKLIHTYNHSQTLKNISPQYPKYHLKK